MRHLDKLNALAGRIEGILARQHRIRILIVGVCAVWLAGIGILLSAVELDHAGYLPRSAWRWFPGLLIVAGIIGAMHLI